MFSEEMQSALVTVRDFLDGKGDPWAWDDLLSLPPRDPAVIRLQGICRQLPSDYPPERRIDYCSTEGLVFLEHVLEGILRSGKIAPEGK